MTFSSLFFYHKDTLSQMRGVINRDILLRLNKPSGRDRHPNRLRMLVRAYSAKKLPVINVFFD